LGLRSFLGAVSRLLKLAKKPGRDELWLSIKICLLGISAIGIIGFIIRFISFAIQGGGTTTTTAAIIGKKILELCR
jgi:protein translocase SEC61 complex gamma subunit